jgi:hypothetical protein
MLQAIRQSKLVLGLLLLAVGGVLVCPHVTHRGDCESAGSVENAEDAVAFLKTGSVEQSSEHDHGHCEYDELHSHDFTLSSSRILIPAPLLSVCSPTAALSPLAPYHQIRALGNIADSSDGPIQALGTIRLLL